jgi:hypothetical protein
MRSRFRNVIFLKMTFLSCPTLGVARYKQKQLMLCHPAFAIGYAPHAASNIFSGKFPTANYLSSDCEPDSQ